MNNGNIFVSRVLHQSMDFPFHLGEPE